MPFDLGTPAWLFELADGSWRAERPMDGRTYRVIVLDQKRYEEAVRTGAFYEGLAGPITDSRRSS